MNNTESIVPMSDPDTETANGEVDSSHMRFHKEHEHLDTTFGNAWFALKAEAFARFFGTPMFIIGQTVFVTIWIILNTIGVCHFDLYPFILLNLAFSTQAAYAAPLILLAQTRQADRDKAHTEADAKHRDDVALEASRRQQAASTQTDTLLELIKKNTELTKSIKQMNKRMTVLTEEVHAVVTAKK